MKGHKHGRLYLCRKTDQGRRRSHNEDRVWAYGIDIAGDGEEDPRGRLYIVADGMGGHSAGEIASSIAVESVWQLYYKDDFVDVEITLRQAIEEANRRIYERSQNTPGEAGMGTTIATAVIKGNELYTAHVGDSRIYLIRDERIVFVTEDHSLVKEQVRNGILSEEEAQKSPMRHVITRSLGNAPEVEVETHKIDLEKGDIIVLCSDGLWEPVGDDTIVEYAAQYIWHDPELACQSLVDAANRAGGSDNISVIVIGVQDEKASPLKTSGWTRKRHPEQDHEHDEEVYFDETAHIPSTRSGANLLKGGLLLSALLLWTLAVAALAFRFGTMKGSVSSMTTRIFTSLPDVLPEIKETATADAMQSIELQAMATRSALATSTLIASLQGTIEAQRILLTSKPSAVPNTIPTSSPPIAKKPSPAPLATKATVLLQPSATIMSGTPSPPTQNLVPTPSMPEATSTPLLTIANTPLPTATMASGVPTAESVSVLISADNLINLKQAPLPNQDVGEVWIASVAIAPEGNAIAAAGFPYGGFPYRGIVYLWEADEGLWKTKMFEDIPRPYSVVFSGDGERLALGYQEGVKVLSTPFNGDGTSLPDAPGEVRSVLYFKSLLVAGGTRGIVAWSAISRTKKWSILENEHITSIRLSPDKSTLAIGTYEGQIWLCRTNLLGSESPGSACTLLEETHQGAVWGLAFTPDGKWLASGGAEGNLVVWDVGLGKVVHREWVKARRFGRGDSIINDLGFSRDGRLLIAATKQGVKTWKFEDGNLESVVNNFLTHRPAGSVVISKDGRILVIGYWSRVELWMLAQP